MTGNAPLPQQTHRIDQGLIDRYARVSGDLNPLHTNPEFAATTLYGRTIAHGMMALAFVSSAMEKWAGPCWAETGTIDVTFLAPVFPGDEIIVTGEYAEPEQPDRKVILISCKTGSGDVLAGRASVQSV